MPDTHQLGATSSTGVNLIDSTRYRIFNYSSSIQRTRVLVPLAGANNMVLSREEKNSREWNWVVYCIRAGYQNRLDDFAAINTQIDAAISFSMGDTATAIYLWEQFGNQAAIRQYRVITGDFDEDDRVGGGVLLRVIGRLHLVTLAVSGA